MTNNWLKASEAARYLGITRQRIYELASTGRLGQRIAGYWVFSPAELDLYRQQRGDSLGGRPKREQGHADVQAVEGQHDALQSPEHAGTVERYIEAALGYATVQPLPSGGYVGASLDFPELHAHGATRAECANALQVDMERLIREKIRLGQPLPAIDGLLPTAADDLD